MTLGEAKNKVYMLLDEHSSGGEIEHDADLELKMTAFFDIAQKQLAGIKKIFAMKSYVLKSGVTGYRPPKKLSTAIRLYVDGKLKRVLWQGGELYIPWSGKVAVLEYFKIPDDLNSESDDETEFEIAEDAQECMPFFVAAQHLVSDLVMDYGAMLTMYDRMVSTLNTDVPEARARHRQVFYGGR